MLENFINRLNKKKVLKRETKRNYDLKYDSVHISLELKFEMHVFQDSLTRIVIIRFLECSLIFFLAV